MINQQTPETFYFLYSEHAEESLFQMTHCSEVCADMSWRKNLNMDTDGVRRKEARRDVMREE